jgi:hypothetical protein
MSEQTQWLERLELAPGRIAEWEGGRLRLEVRHVEPLLARERWWSRKQVVMGYWLSLQATTPAHGSFEHRCYVARDGTGASTIWPPPDFSARFEPTLTPFFEICEVVDAEAGRVQVRAGYAPLPPTAAASGDLASLDAAAQRFITWWQQASPDRAPVSAQGAMQPPPARIEGYAVVTDMHSSARQEVTFHRSGEQYYVRSYGGCIVPMELWYGPYVAGASGYYLAK